MKIKKILFRTLEALMYAGIILATMFYTHGNTKRVFNVFVACIFFFIISIIRERTR